MGKKSKKGRKKIRVAILMGGDSNEREISLTTGRTVAAYLDKVIFRCRLYDTKKDIAAFFSAAQKGDIDVAFIALHGRGGEDGTIQGMLKTIGIPYTGPGVLASAIGLDKSVSKAIFLQEGIPTPRFISGSAGGKGERNFLFEVGKKAEKAIGFPCVVKPNSSGSSLGVSIVSDKKQLSPAIRKALKEDQKIIIEKYIRGKEITVGVLGNRKIEALPVVGIFPKKGFFDYKTKYDPRLCQEIAPAPIPPQIARKAQDTAKMAYRAIGCRGFSRVDMIMAGKKIYVLEINTIPGLTPNSLLPKAAKAAGISFPQLLKKIIGLALKK